MSQEKFKTSIGGQALIEGVMMRGPKKTAMAVRQPDQEIYLETWDTGTAKWYSKVPFLRGSFNMISSLILGYKTLMKSAEIAGQEEDMEPSKFETWVSEKLGKDIMTIVAVFAAILGGGLALVLFTILPTVIAGLFKGVLGAGVLRSLAEGVIKIAIFVAYLALVSKMPDIRRVFEYHGAEHKTIACYEAEQPLTVENVKPMTRLHRRCGTSFLLIVLVVSIIVFSFITLESSLLRTLVRIVLIPVVVGIAYEIIRLAGRYDNIITRAVSAPGLWLQRLTTNEPDDKQIEIAIAAMEGVIPQDKGADAW